MPLEPDRLNAAYQFLFERCAPLQFEPPWSFVPPDPNCRGRVIDPPETLAALRAQFPDGVLAEAGILKAAPDGTVWLTPALTVRAGAIIALREKPDDMPSDLLTALGRLSGRDPVQGARQDPWTQEALEKNGLLFAATRIREVALLRGFGFAATLALGLSRLTVDLSGVDALRETWGEEPELSYDAVTAEALAEDVAFLSAEKARIDDLDNAADEDSEPIMTGSEITWADAAAFVANEKEANEFPPSPSFDPAKPTMAVGEKSSAAGTASVSTDPAQPTTTASEAAEEQPEAIPASMSIDPPKPSLVLVAWQPLTLGRGLPALLRRFAAQVEELTRYLDVHLPQLAVWRPGVEDLKRLTYRLRFHDFDLVQKTLATSVDDLFDLDYVRRVGTSDEIEPEPMTFGTARAQLLASLAETKRNRQVSERVREATATYEAIVQRDLVGPMLEWALRQHNPVIRNAATEFAELTAVMHRMSPLLHDKLVRHLEENGGARDDELWSMIREYLQIHNHYCKQARMLIDLWKNRDE
jgi:hypothetical protein